MDEDTFWRLISKSALKGDDPDAEGLAEALAARLRTETAETVVGFAEQLAWVLYRLDRREFAEAGAGEYVSADAFLYTRAAIVAAGREIYEQVLQEPALFASYAEEMIWAEPLLYVVDGVYQELTGEEWDRETRYSYESFSNADGWAQRSTG